MVLRVIKSCCGTMDYYAAANKRSLNMKDCCNQEIVPIRKKLSIHRNRHPSTDGTDWGWIEGCDKNICWANNHSFNHQKAAEFVERHNKAVEAD